MRHGKKLNHLSRKAGHRKALMKNLASALIEHKRITTTLAKAKALRVYVEPLVTKSKENTTTNRRTVFSYLQSKTAVTELFDVIGGKVADRPGGYTRIIKLGTRQGDAAEMALIELVDFNENLLTETKTKSTGKKRRSRRGGGKSKSESTATTTEAPAKEAKEETKAAAAEETAEAPVEETAAEAPVAAAAEAPATEETPAEESAEAKEEEQAESKEEEAGDEEDKKEDKV